MIYLIGNPTHDTITISNHSVKTFGGTVWYAALFLVRLKAAVAVVGKGDQRMKNRLAASGVDTRFFQLSKRILTFENDYTPQGRLQRARAGEKLCLADVPPGAFTAAGILAGPLLQDVDTAILEKPRSGWLLLDAQGFVRQVSPAGEVILKMGPEAETAIRHCDILKVDHREAAVITATDDVEAAGRRLQRLGPQIVIITQGAGGADLFDGNRLMKIAAPAVDTIDPTGAGDVFSAAFLMRFIASGDPVAAGRFAVTAAALSTRGFGTTALPADIEIDCLMKSHF